MWTLPGSYGERGSCTEGNVKCICILFKKRRPKANVTNADSQLDGGTCTFELFFVLFCISLMSENNNHKNQHTVFQKTKAVIWIVPHLPQTLISYVIRHVLGFFFVFFLIFIWFVLVVALGIFFFFNCSMWNLVPLPEVKPRPPALEMQSLSH